MTAAARCSFQADVDGHFGGALSAPRERRLRAHLPACGACHARYDQWLLLAAVDDRIPDARARLAAGLGLHGRARRALAPVAFGLAALACCALLVLRGPRRAGELDELTARGAPAAAASTLVVYDLEGGGAAPVRLEPGAAIAASDELGFAYTNPAGWRRLLVLGVDDRRHIYWFHPGWTDPATNPVGVLVQRGELLRELAEAIQHELAGSELRIFALFTNRDDLGVREVEAAVGPEGQAPRLEGCEVRALSIRVRGRGP
jgi:hypothetical protein